MIRTRARSSAPANPKPWTSPNPKTTSQRAAAADRATGSRADPRDRRGDERLDDRRRRVNATDRDQRQRHGVGDGEGRERNQQLTHGTRCQDQAGQKHQMVVAGEDVTDATVHEMTMPGRAVEGDVRRGRPPATGPGVQHASRLATRSSTVTVTSSRWPRASRRGMSEVMTGAALAVRPNAVANTNRMRAPRRRSRSCCRVERPGTRRRLQSGPHRERVPQSRPASVRTSGASTATSAADTESDGRVRRAADADLQGAQARIVCQHRGRVEQEHDERSADPASAGPAGGAAWFDQCV